METAAKSWVRGRPLGVGAHAAVHLAVDSSTGHVFAVKSVCLTSSPLASLRAFENEVQILKSLSSPYVVSYLGDDTAGGRRNLHLEFMPGGTAAEGAQDDEPRVREYAQCVALALRYLHDVDVVHCDVKGRNVLLSGGGRGPAAKLADFGVAVRVGAATGDCASGGTPLWMAPEVARGERPKPAADVWSLGCTLIEMATGGAPPWPNLAGEDAIGAMLRIGYGEGTPELPAKLSEIGRDFVTRCLRRDARERWTAEQLLSHPFLAKLSTVTEPSPRGVLEWSKNDDDGVDEDDTGEEFECISNNHEEDSDAIVAGARERMRELAWEGRQLNWWRSEGWQLARGTEAEEDEDKEQSCSVFCFCHCFQSYCCWCFGSSLIFGLYHFWSHLFIKINIILHLSKFKTQPIHEY